LNWLSHFQWIPQNESLWNHTTTDHKEGEQLEDRKSVGASSCNSGDGTDQRIQSLMFMIMMMIKNFFIWKRETQNYIYIYIYTHTWCPRRNVPDFGRVFLMLKYTDITQNTYVQSWTVTEIMAREKCGHLAGPRTVPVSWQSYPFPSLSVVSYDGISAHASHWIAHVGLYRNARSAMLRHRWTVMCHV